MKIQSTPKVLAAGAALFLGAVLALAASIVHGTGAGPFNAPEVVQNIVAQKDLVTPRELARWIIEKKHDYQLIDIRQPWQYSDYHIPTAVNIPLTELFGPQGIKQLSRSEKLVIYGFGTGQAAEAQLLLSLKGYDSYSLGEGISGWWKDIMTPASLLSESASPAGYVEAKQLREYFTETAKTGAEPASAVSQPMPRLPPSTKPPVQKQRLKLGRGCS
jgi:rhodanese-related sulfurtransferase